MRKSKQGKALFDLFTNEGPGTAEPLKEPAGKGMRGQVVPAPVMKSTAVERIGQTIPRAPVLPGPPRGSVVELEGARVRLTVTSWSAALIAFFGIMMVFAAFKVGQWVADGRGFDRGYAAGREAYVADTASEIEMARQKPASTDLIASLLQAPSAKAKYKENKPVAVASREDVTPRKREARRSPATSIEDPAKPKASPNKSTAKTRSSWVRNYTYIVAQEFSAGRDEDAKRAQSFLADNGVRTDRIRYASGSIQLITLQGYNRGDSTQRRMSDTLLKKVHAIGSKYYGQGGGYKLEGYFKKLKGEAW